MTRSREVIDRELALLAVVRAAARGMGGNPSTELVDQLLDERLKQGKQWHSGRIMSRNVP